LGYPFSWVSVLELVPVLLDATTGSSGVIGTCRLHEALSVIAQSHGLGSFDAVIQNAAVGYQEKKRIKTTDGLAQAFATNTLAPYILTALIHRPKRLVYISSGLADAGDGRASAAVGRVE